MLKKFYGTKAEIPEGVASFYVEKDGKFVLNVDGGFEDVTGLKSALTSERSLRETAEKGLKTWTDSGIESADKASDLLKRLDELSKLDPKKEAEKIAEEKVNLIRTQLAEKAGVREKELLTNNESLTSQLTKQLVDNAARKALSEHKGDPNLLMPHIQSKIRMVKNSAGEYTAQVLDNVGNARVGADAKDMNISDLVIEMKADSSFAKCFDGTGATGSGGGSGTGAGTVDSPMVLDRNDPFAVGNHAEELADGRAVLQED